MARSFETTNYFYFVSRWGKSLFLTVFKTFQDYKLLLLRFAFLRPRHQMGFHSFAFPGPPKSISISKMHGRSTPFSLMYATVTISILFSAAVIRRSCVHVPRGALSHDYRLFLFHILNFSLMHNDHGKKPSTISILFDDGRNRTLGLFPR